MILKKLSVNNYKSLHHTEIVFEGKNTIIFGVNGVGKSSVLSAINLLASVWINRLNGRNSNNSINDSDIYIGESELSIQGIFCLDEKEYPLSRYYQLSVENDRSRRVNYDKKEYETFVREFSEKYLNSASEEMPVYVFYGTNRAVINIPYKQENQKYDMLSALEKAIDSSVDFKRFFEWFRDSESRETKTMRNAIESNLPVTSDRMLDKVRFAIESIIENVSDLKVQYDPVRMTVMKDGQEIRVDMLSDGEKCTLALFGDLARRLCLANPRLDDPFKGKGIVLIDEIELHMHPSWQRKVLSKLNELFPNIQFIVTTHSPQVLGEADNNYLILAIDENTKTINTIKRLDGYDSNYILEEYMHTSSKNEETQSLIDMINELIVRKDFKNAETKLSYLKDIVGNDNEDYILASGFFERSRRINVEN